MITISFVEQERTDKGELVVHYDPRGGGLSDYVIYRLYTSKWMTPTEMREAGQYICEVLNAAHYDNSVLAEVAREPIACYAKNHICIELILFSHFSENEIVAVLTSGIKELASRKS